MPSIAHVESLINMDLREKIKTLISKSCENYLEVSQLLYEVKSEKLFRDWGFKTFKQYYSSDLNLADRRAAYFLKIYEKLVIKNEIDSKDLLEIGWSKAAALLPVINNENKEEWLEKARSLPIQELLTEVRSKDPRKPPVDINILDDVGIEHTDTATFKQVFYLNKEQLQNIKLAFDVANKKAKTENPAYLLDLICLAYLATEN